MNTQANEHAAARGRHRRRQAQSVGGGSWWARVIAPPRGSARRRTIAALETIVATLAAVAICWAFDHSDPLLVQSGFGWVWIVPLVIALRYGTIAGVVSGLILLGSWYVLYPDTSNAAAPISFARALMEPPGARLFPVSFFLGGFVITMLCGQFGDIWITRLRQGRVANDYLAERLSILTRNQFMLRISHERLEQDLLGRPATLRDSLARLRTVVLNQEPTDAQHGLVDLRGAQPFLEAAAQACQIESASVHAWRSGKPSATAAASIGAPSAFEPDDPLVREALDTRTLVHVESKTNQDMSASRYVVVVPLIDAQKNPVGVLAVERMPFLALTRDNLQLLLVLCNFYADGVQHAVITRDTLGAFPTCPHTFALDYARLVHLQRDTQVRSSIVALVFHNDERSTTLYEHVLRTRRALDVQWPLRDERHRVVLTLMPLSGDSAVDGYLLRIEENLRAQYGVDFEAARVAVHSMAVPADEPGAALRRLLERCDVRF
ncbi:PelD GGDEF domain-containing protein [Paraburkholderia sp. C35]|uniref:PelD GGDEF domain-containing protein n=1 Tax=Paraburkholderia sp. C35 TaxID=2126993 RepID=UPI000D689B0F|nr:PelD GGDEF domain-containing protein [Paraburkholderia sp. C35]